MLENFLSKKFAAEQVNASKIIINHVYAPVSPCIHLLVCVVNVNSIKKIYVKHDFK